jgi:hypothetical protein
MNSLSNSRMCPDLESNQLLSEDKSHCYHWFNLLGGLHEPEWKEIKT